jgi:hypothetical protein
LTETSNLIHAPGDLQSRFRDSYNRAPFAFEHHIAGHELFQLPRLAELIKRLDKFPGQVYYDLGSNSSVGRGWDQSGQHAADPEQLIRSLETAGAWMILKSSQTDPAYADFLEACLGELHSLSGRDMARETHGHIMSIIVTSPGKVTPYHIDGECNYLFQIRGSKVVYVFDGSDRAVLPDDELERFWAGNLNAAKYRETTQPQAHAFELQPGRAIHVPVNYPHWVQNGPGVSISVSMNFSFRDRRVADLYRANHALRRLGLHPAPPGKSKIADSTKLMAYRLHSTIRRRRAG